MYIGANLGGHLVLILPAKCSSSGNERCLTSVESEKLCQWCLHKSANPEQSQISVRNCISYGGAICPVPGRIAGADCHYTSLLWWKAEKLLLWKQLKSCCLCWLLCGDSSSLVLWSQLLLYCLLVLWMILDKELQLMSRKRLQARGRGWHQHVPHQGRTGPSSEHCGLHRALACLLWTSSWFKIRIGKFPSRLALDVIYPSGEALVHCTTDKHQKLLLPKPILSEVVPVVDFTLQPMCTFNMPHI